MSNDTLDLMGSLSTIHRECFEFLQDSNHIPVYKVLPSNYPNFCKIKARFKNKGDDITPYFNKAFENHIQNIRQRAIFGYPSIPNISKGYDLFYIFPINGYNFLYSKEVTNSNSDYKYVLDTLFDAFENSEKAGEIITDLLKYTYSSINLSEGLRHKAEIAFYGIPYYYAMRTTFISNYSNL